KELLELAKRSDWKALRKELIVTQNDVENAMLDLRDEELAHLLSLGGWIRGLEIAAASVAADWTPERVAKLRQMELLDYFLQQLDTLSPPLKSTPLISRIITALKSVRQKLTVDPPLSKEDVSSIRDTARDLVALIDEQNPPSGMSPRYWSTWEGFGGFWLPGRSRSRWERRRLGEAASLLRDRDLSRFGVTARV